MQRYRRRRRAGGSFFFTLVTYGREPFLTTDVARPILRESIEDCRKDHPFTIDAIVLLPDHLHCIWTLPAGDSDYSTRWKLVKATFTREWTKTSGHEGVISAARERGKYRGVWQRRFCGAHDRR